MENADVFLGLHDFLERMRKPSAADFVKSIKSFIVSISNTAHDPEKDCAAVQEFFSKMEAAFRVHPLWSGCTEEELESAGEGLEKYVMTKLFTRVFASLPEDVQYDEQLSQKIALIQQFVRPENLDIKPTFQNETSWLLAQKELQKINMYKAPRDKLVCILNCCKVINNLLLNASISSIENPPGADEFLPVLIYVTIKANPPQLHSNLLYIQRYRRQSKLVGEAAYFFTNMLSAESFISNIDAKALSMDEAEFENNMEFARALLSGLDGQSNQTNQTVEPFATEGPTISKRQVLSSRPEDILVQSKSSDNISGTKDGSDMRNQLPIMKAQSLSDLENKGAALLLKDNQASKVFQEYPYVFANAADLTISNVEDLLNSYKQLLFKYVCLSKGLSGATPSFSPSSSPDQVQRQSEGAKEPEDHNIVVSNVDFKRDTDAGEENVYLKLSDTKGEDEDVESNYLYTKDKIVDSNVPQTRDEDFDSKPPQTEDDETDSKNQCPEGDALNLNLRHAEGEHLDSKHQHAEDEDADS